MNRRKPQFNEPPRLGYSGAPSGAQYEWWREEFCRRVMTGDVVPIGEGPVRCDITAVPLPRVKMSGASGTPMQFIATGADTDEALALVLTSEAPMQITVGKRSVDLPSNSVGLADAAHVGAVVSQTTQGGFRSLFIERKALLTLCPGAEDLIARPLNNNNGVGSLLRQYYDLVVSHSHSLDALAMNAAAQHLIDLTLLLLGAGRDETQLATRRGMTAARLEAIKADVLARLSDNTLNLTDVAQRNGVSRRTIQLMFERSGQTFSDFILEQRLLLASRLLRDPQQNFRKITDIAYLVGFNDVSYFHRAFRKKFSMTPSDVRNTLQQP